MCEAERWAAELVAKKNNAFNMSEIELQRLERCKKCSKSEEANGFQGGTKLYCPLHGFECSEVVQCVYVPDNKRYE